MKTYDSFINVLNTIRSSEYKMMVIESLDADTEVRRLSPVALSADGYINLLNGPQDHGWCFGYTCQERISTFYTVMALQRNYTMYFTGRYWFIRDDDSHRYCERETTIVLKINVDRRVTIVSEVI